MRESIFKKSLVQIVSGILLVSQVAYAMPERPIKFANMHGFDQDAIMKAKHVTWGNLYDANFSKEDLEFVLSDKENRINNDFRIPEELRPAVNFWLKIYTLYSSRHAILVDSEHLDVVYDVIDLRKLAETSRNAVVYEIVSKKKVENAVKKFKKAFASLAKNSHPKKPTREEEIILKATKDLPRQYSFKDMAKNMKVMRGQRDNIIKGLITADTFLPKMELLFAKMNIPVELTRITLVESSFNLQAGSRVGAFGVWQIMPSVGKSYLLIDSDKKIDERLSPLKATLAAGKLLKFNYKYLGNWILAIVAYNHGIKHLPRFKNDQFNFTKIAQLFDPANKKSHLGFASRNYYPGFLALLYAETYQKMFYGVAPVASNKPVAYKQLDKAQSAYSYIAENKLNMDEFKFYNSDIKDFDISLPKGFWVAIPGEESNIANTVLHGLDGRVAMRKASKAKHATSKKARNKKRHVA